MLNDIHFQLALFLKIIVLKGLILVAFQVVRVLEDERWHGRVVLALVVLKILDDVFEVLVHLLDVVVDYRLGPELFFYSPFQASLEQGLQILLLHVIIGNVAYPSTMPPENLRLLLNSLPKLVHMLIRFHFDLHIIASSLQFRPLRAFILGIFVYN